MQYPRVAYVLHWFPEPTETFIFNEVSRLDAMGLPIKVYTLYGRLTANLSPEMLSARTPVERLGLPHAARVGEDLLYWKKKDSRRLRYLFRHVPWRRWNDLENTGENLWAFLCGFRLARLFRRDAVNHIHAPWANGPATAAWVASDLTGIPFSLAVHATDIYPPDGSLVDKITHCTFLRSENRANVEHLAAINSLNSHRSKFHTVYSGHPLKAYPLAEAPMTPPFRILALGRLVPKKGFHVLLHACGILRDRKVDFQLVIGGDGRCRHELERLANHLDLTRQVEFPGFVPQDGVSHFLKRGDLFVMPSMVDGKGDRDGLPNVILEALLHRLPVVASSVCAIPEVIRDGDTGYLVPQGDPLALADAVCRVLQDRDRAIAMAERGRQAVLEGFDLNRSCRAMLCLFWENSATLKTSSRDWACGSP